MALSNPFNPPPNTPLLPDPQRDSVWRRWFEQLWRRIQTGALGGTVTSVAVTAPVEFSVSGSPITTSGTIAITKANETANTVWAGPTTGAAAQPTFRALVAADLPAGTGTVTSVNVSGGTTGLSFSGGPITTSGTITMAGTLDADNGGTGLASYAVGDIIYASTTTALAKLADVATGNALISGGVNTVPSWGKIGLTTHVSGVLPLANGGTASALTDPNADRIMFWDDSAGAVDWLTAGAGLSISGTTLTATGTGTVTTVSVVSANGLAGTVANATTTPAITLSTSITGFLQGNGTAISAASTTGSGSVLALQATPSFSTTIGVGAATASASGAGISFPATQSASTDSNTLDDYEEGTWTPGFSFGGGTTGITYVGQVGVYTKIGNAVTVACVAALSSKGSSTGSALLTGLPFTSSSVANYIATLAPRLSSMAASYTTSAQLDITASSTSSRIWKFAAGTLTAASDADFNNNSACAFSGVYHV